MDSEPAHYGWSRLHFNHREDLLPIHSTKCAHSTPMSPRSDPCSSAPFCTSGVRTSRAFWAGLPATYKVLTTLRPLPSAAVVRSRFPGLFPAVLSPHGRHTPRRIQIRSWQSSWACFSRRRSAQCDRGNHGWREGPPLTESWLEFRSVEGLHPPDIFNSNEKRILPSAHPQTH